MGHFLLTESDTGVSEPQVIAVVLVRIVEIVLSLNIEATAFFKQIGISQMTDIGLYSIRRDGVFSIQSLSGV